MSLNLTIDPDRMMGQDDLYSTGIYVRAIRPDGRADSVDIVMLDRPSLLRWLRSRGGHNPWAEDVVGILLGHGHLTTEEEHP